MKRIPVVGPWMTDKEIDYADFVRGSHSVSRAVRAGLDCLPGPALRYEPSLLARPSCVAPDGYLKCVKD